MAKGSDERPLGKAGTVLAGIRRASLMRGVLGGDKRWVVVAAGVWGLHGLAKATARQTGVVWSGPVAEGEQLLVTYHPPKRRRDRR